MLRDTKTIIVNNTVKVLHVFEQHFDGSLLYSCYPKDSVRTNYTEVRLFNPTTNHDKLIYVHEGNSSIVNASLNPEHTVLAFTTFLSHENAGIKNASQTSAGNDQNSDAYKTKQNPNWFSPLDFEKCMKQCSTETGVNCSRVDDADSISAILNTDCHLSQGIYRSYLVDTPMTWLRKFDLERSRYQRVIFTSCSTIHSKDNCLLKENRLLLIMHRKCIGLYVILLKEERDKERDHGKKDANFNDASERRIEVLQPISVASNPLWCQWDPKLQQLYYIVVTKHKHKRTDRNSTVIDYSLFLRCVQFDNGYHQFIFDCPLELSLSSEIFKSSGSSYLLHDLDPSVSSPSLNMRLLQLPSGGMCLCWQVFTDSQQDYLYQILVLHENIVIQCDSITLNTEVYESVQDRISFSVLADNILVYCKERFLHFLSTDSFRTDQDPFAYHCHYITKCNPTQRMQLDYFCQMPYQPSDIYGEDSNECAVFDCVAKNVSTLAISVDLITENFHDIQVTTENKIAVSRFACGLLKDQTKSFSLLKETLIRFLEEDMTLITDSILSSILVQMAKNDVVTKFPEATHIHRLLPTSISFNNSCSNEFSLRTKIVSIRERLMMKLEQLLTIKHPNQIEFWKKTVAFLKNGQHKSYDLHDIDEAIASKGHLPDRKTIQEMQLTEIFKKNIFLWEEGDITKDDDDILGSFSSYAQNLHCENVIALTYEYLTRHLKQYVEDDSLLKSIARDYVIAQLHSVNHIFALFLLVTNVEDHDQPLFHPVVTEERKLLKLLNQLLSACISNNFPLQKGFQTYLTCLTFRCCLNTHLVISGDDCTAYLSDTSGSSSSNSLNNVAPIFSSSPEDMKEFLFDFLQLVDSSCIQLTGEFIARLLEELPPNNCIYDAMVHEILTHANFSCSVMPEGIFQCWESHYSASLLAEAQLVVSRTF